MNRRRKRTTTTTTTTTTTGTGTRTRNKKKDKKEEEGQKEEKEEEQEEKEEEQEEKEEEEKEEQEEKERNGINGDKKQHDIVKNSNGTLKVSLPVCAAWEIVRFKATLTIFARATFFLEKDSDKEKFKQRLLLFLFYDLLEKIQSL